MNYELTESDDAAIREDPRVQHYEQVIRDGMVDAAEPFEWLFSRQGRLVSASLGAARVRAAINLRRSSQ